MRAQAFTFSAPQKTLTELAIVNVHGGLLAQGSLVDKKNSFGQVRAMRLHAFASPLTCGSPRPRTSINT